MKKMIIIVFFLAGCVGTIHHFRELSPNQFQKCPTDALFEESYGSVWESTISALSNFPITLMDKDVGLIVTDSKTTQEAPFIFIMNSNHYGKGIFKSDQDGYYSRKRERLNVRVKTETGGTRVSIITTVEVYFDNTYITSKPTKEWRPAESDSITERRILEIIENNLKDAQVKPTSSDP